MRIRKYSQNFILFIGFLFLMSCAEQRVQKQELAEIMKTSLHSNLLDAWYPVTVDSLYGGFLADFAYDRQADGPQNKMIVTQTRHVWTASRAAMFFDQQAYRDIAEHGYHFLREKMWDDVYGGFYTIRDRSGQAVSSRYGDEKMAYGHAFAIYALSSYYDMSGDSSALDLAKRTFNWLEEHSHDPEYGGYFDRLHRDGSWVKDPLWKDQNSSIHLLEAFTALYALWPDDLLRERLHEMLLVIRDRIVANKSYLTLFLQRDWTPISFRDSTEAVRRENYHYDHVSFGHDVETAYLMLEASHALGLEADVETQNIAKKMVDHALANGWDDNNGGFYYEGYYYNDVDSCTIINDAKSWWVQAEGLNVLLLMSQLYPGEAKYQSAFLKQWEYIDRFLIDHQHGGWYTAGLDTRPQSTLSDKASNWKVNYHNARALMNCYHMLTSGH